MTTSRDQYTPEQRAAWQRERMALEAKRPAVVPKRNERIARWNPAKPLQYFYGPDGEYDPADYAAFKQARLAYLKTHAPDRVAKTPAPDEATRDRMRAGLDARIAEAKRKHPGRTQFDDLTITSEARGTSSMVLKTPWYTRIFKL